MRQLPEPACGENGDLVQHTDRNGSVTKYTYDGLDRLTDEQMPQGEVSYGGACPERMRRNNANRRTTMTVAGQPTGAAYAWDNANRLTGITQGDLPRIFGLGIMWILG